MLRDKSNTSTQIYTLTKSADFSYLADLQEQCRLARMTCQHEMDELKRRRGQANGRAESGPKNQESRDDDRVQVMVGERELREPSREEKMSSLGNSLLTIDMIECSRVRVDELLQAFKPN